MRVSIVGGGYVGLVSGACLAEQGHAVTIVDNIASRVEQIMARQAPFFEPELDDLLVETIGSKLNATVDLDEAVNSTDLTMIAVGTPSRDDGSVDLAAIENVSREIGQIIGAKSEYHVVVVKSTVPPGTTENVVGPIIESSSGKIRGTEFGLGMNPEFLTEGTAVADFREPDRIVIGGDQGAIEAQKELYAGFIDAPVVIVTNSTAEMIKYMSNALLATMISFANEFSDLCEAVGGVDIVEVQKGVHLSRYLTHGSPAATAPIASFVEAGCGFGGSCLPKDVKGLISVGKKAGCSMRLLSSVIAINAERPGHVVKILQDKLTTVVGANISLLGLSFRPDTNDMRESPALQIIDGLLRLGCNITAYDPKAMPSASQIVPQAVSMASSIEDCVCASDAIILATRWTEFEELPSILHRLGSDPVVIDGRRMMDKNVFANYAGVGL